MERVAPLITMLWNSGEVATIRGLVQVSNFWLSEVIRGTSIFLLSYVLGQWVIRRGVRVNYTRKIVHFFLAFLPVFMATLLPYEVTLGTIFVGAVFFLAVMALFLRPVRERVPVVRIAFHSFDRPEDRPYTMLWMMTQLAALYLVLLPMIVWLAAYDKVVLIYMTILVSGLGDGLAEPVGVRFGRHHYRVRALFTDRVYTRTLEGSACVFVTAILAVVLMQGQLTTEQFLVGLLLFPPAMTLTEAWSPHTWDQPFLFLVGGVVTVVMLELPALF